MNSALTSADADLSAPDNDPKRTILSLHIRKYVCGLALMWTVLVGVSLAWNIWQESQGSLELARLHATTAFEKDLLYRKWIASHGGVYVRVDERTKPNALLANLRERNVETSHGTLTLINPAIVSREVYDMERMNFGVRSHITSLNPVRRGNAADPWETKALLSFRDGSQQVHSVEQLDGKAYMRLMRPLMTEKGCLHCHLEHGYKVGDVRGGISVSIPMEPIRTVARKQKIALATGHGFLWVFGLGGIVVVGEYLRRQIQHRLQSERELQESEADRRMLGEHNARLAAEQSLVVAKEKLRLAAEIQTALLPDKAPLRSGLDIAGILRPSDETGGDLYDFLIMPDGCLGIVIADVSGHGIDSALLMSATIAHVRVLATFCNDVGDILRRLNALIVEETADNHFVTMFLARLDTTGRVFSYASAGHRSYLIKSDGAVETLDATCPPVGVIADLDVRETSPAPLERGDAILLLTDGILEAMNASGELFGQARVVDLVKGHCNQSSKEIVELLHREARQFAGDGSQSDDMTAVVVKVQ